MNSERSNRPKIKIELNLCFRNIKVLTYLGDTKFGRVRILKGGLGTLKSEPFKIQTLVLALLFNNVQNLCLNLNNNIIFILKLYIFLQ